MNDKLTFETSLSNVPIPETLVNEHPSNPTLIRLSDLRSGQSARLHTATLAANDCALLKALGLTDRCMLRICKVGEPCIVQVHSTRIGLSRSVAEEIFVVPEPPAQGS